MRKHKYKNSGYSEGAASREKPALKQYNPRSYSSKLDIDYNIPTLRNRSTDLILNSALGSAVLSTFNSGILGSGLKVFPQPKIKELGMTPEQGREWSQAVQNEFNNWAMSLDCDFYRRNNFYELQRIILMEYLSKGDCYTLLRRSASGRYTLQLQVIESQRVSNPLTEGAAINQVEMIRGNNRIVNGIEVDKYGRLQAIWISNRIWNEPVTLQNELKWQRVRFIGENGNRNILQICYDTRPEQYRGAPVLSPVIEVLKQISRYAEAELTSSIIRSFYSLFFVQPASNFNLNEIAGEDLDVNEYKLGSGTINALPRGVDVRSIESNNAQSTFETFITQFSKQVGAALGIPYEVLTKEYQSSYSASRAAILEAEREFKQRRAAFVNDLCQPVYENFLIEAVARGRISAPGFFDDDKTRYSWSVADWRDSVMAHIDPLKEAQAAKLRLEMGVTTREIECIRNGEDFWQLVEQLKREREIIPPSA